MPVGGRSRPATGTAAASPGPRAPCGPSSSTRATRATRCGTSSASRSRSSTSTTSLSATRPGWPGTALTPGRSRHPPTPHLSTGTCSRRWRATRRPGHESRAGPPTVRTRAARTLFGAGSGARPASGGCRAPGTTAVRTTAAGFPTSTRSPTRSTTHSRFMSGKIAVPELDSWLAGVFDPLRVEQTLDTLAEASDAGRQSRENEDARRAVTECDRKLARHRAALEAGADPTLVAEWTTEVQRERVAAIARLGPVRSGAPQRLSKAEIHRVVVGLGGLLNVLRRASPGDKEEVYRELGVEIRYRHHDRTALVEARPRVCVVSVSEGGLGPEFAAPLRQAGVHVPKSTHRTLGGPRPVVVALIMTMSWSSASRRSGGTSSARVHSRYRTSPPFAEGHCTTTASTRLLSVTTRCRVSLPAPVPGPARRATTVVLTGGEPLLQVDEALVTELHARGFYIAVETNGTRLPPSGTRRGGGVPGPGRRLRRGRA